ncbi:hypothetical protein [Nocardioides massiliensis]|uniref:hypothetical protein n=1 Tax=Nocardioides massiliensis TaxID=1325935 RepID=UPI000833A51E|nr:hypothetical protein [Nocardioides massiliensis]
MSVPAMDRTPVPVWRSVRGLSVLAATAVVVLTAWLWLRESKPVVEVAPPAPPVRTVYLEAPPAEDADELAVTPGEDLGRRARGGVERAREFGEDFLRGFQGQSLP